jgi:shikimate dehydrogenase
VSGGTALYGLAGVPLGHSLSPAMHNAAFEACGLDAVYVPLESRDLIDFLVFAERFGLSGASVTAPFKVALLDRVTSTDDVSRRVGAVNTLRLRDGRREGANTDLAGFLAPLQGEPIEGMRAAVVGSGGAARVVAIGLASRGARVTVHGRDAERAARVAWLAGGRAAAGLPPSGSWDVLVNATPVGTHPDTESSLFGEAELRGGRLVYDLVYNPQPSRLLREAAAAGCRTIGGFEMLLGQAAAQFEWWTGLEAPRGVMRDAATARLAAMTGGA